MLTYSEIESSWIKATSETQLPGINQAYEYLRKRGISPEYAGELGLHIVPAAELRTAARGSTVHDPRLAIVFPHEGSEWWSARLVDTGLRKVTSFADMTALKGKMTCPPNEPVHAYLVPTLDWGALQKGDRVYIHESAIKAANGARLGFWSIGLNGVRGWSAQKHGIALVDELRGLPWRALELQPTIVFDSNCDDNWDVQDAAKRLAAKLFELTGRTADLLVTPRAPDGQHQGFDDYAVASGDEVAHAFLNGPGQPIDISERELMVAELNTKVCVVRSLGRVAEQATGTIMSEATFTRVNYATWIYYDEDDRPVSAAKQWMTDPRRTEVESMDYMPGKERICEDKLNTWRGMGVEPESGDVSKWLAVLEMNVPDAALRKWMIQWMAYPLQNLGAKLNTFIHMYGPPGTGKQAILLPLMKIYGSNSITLSKQNIASDFNSVYSGKQFINVDEMHSENSQGALAITNKIKMLVTDPFLVVNTKGVPEYRTTNCAQLVTTSNYLDSIRLDDDDRRCAVIKFGERGRTHDREFWEAYFAWAESDAGAAALYHHLLDVDMAGFDPKGWAPMTEDKREVTRATRSVLEQWIEDLRDDPDSCLSPAVKNRALFSPDELAPFAFAEDPNGVTSNKKNALGIKLHSAGFAKVPLKIDGKKLRFWVVRDKDKDWTPEAARRHLKLHGYPGA